MLETILVVKANMDKIPLAPSIEADLDDEEYPTEELEEDNEDNIDY